MLIDLIALLISYPLKTFTGITSHILLLFIKEAVVIPLYFHRPKFSHILESTVEDKVIGSLGSIIRVKFSLCR